MGIDTGLPRALALLALVLVLLAPAPASGAPRWLSKDLPLAPSLAHRMALVPLAPPSPEHPLGTVAIISPDAAYAWDLEARRFLTGRSLGATSNQESAVVAVRADDEIFVLAGSTSETASPSEIVLLTLGPDLVVRSRDVVGRGILPSLAVSDPWIVAGSFERHAPAADDPLGLAFHAVVLDRKTRAIVAGRVFQGARAFAAGPQPDWASHALATTELPSLRTVKRGRPPERPITTDDGCAPLIAAWGHPVGLCGGKEGVVAPMRIRFRR